MFCAGGSCVRGPYLVARGFFVGYLFLRCLRRRHGQDSDRRGRGATRRGSALKTQTKKDTVNAALRLVTALAARRRDLQRLTSGGLPDLADEDVMRAAWQR
jgi:hypothetical protein